MPRKIRKLLRPLKIQKLLSNRRSGTIIVLGGKEYLSLFQEINYYNVSSSFDLLTQDPSSVKLVVFTGGEDIHPKLYGGADIGVSEYNYARDIIEIDIFNTCRKHNIKMAGICRGMQFLNVMAGGKLWQHVNNHDGVAHKVWTPMCNTVAGIEVKGNSFLTNSYHHQLVELPSGSVPVLWTNPSLASFRLDHNCKKYFESAIEIEGAIYPMIESFGVQYHPEGLNHRLPGCKFFLDMVKSFLSVNISQFAATYGGEYGRSQQGA